MLPHTYESADGATLAYDVFYPEVLHSNLPALILFFGGAWVFGGRHKFYPQAEYFASLGYVVFTPDYRVFSRQRTTPQKSVEDAVAFWRHIRDGAARFGIDPARIAMGGGSSGGHLALMAGLLVAQPKAFVLYNPAVTLPKAALSPMKNLAPGTPPTLVLHGSLDVIIPLPLVERFCAKLRQLGSEALLYVYPRRGHGFFRLDRGETAYLDTNRKVAAFLKAYL
ncbi:MAG: alpha/beta hydrolase [Oscillospiraceae bacterium]|jgi:acetyl esterase/lipase|nr:alpha/beta hydrolase [Oscillospiraceae bacterium]